MRPEHERLVRSTGGHFTVTKGGQRAGEVVVVQKADMAWEDTEVHLRAGSGILGKAHYAEKGIL